MYYLQITGLPESTALGDCTTDGSYPHAVALGKVGFPGNTCLGYGRTDSPYQTWKVNNTGAEQIISITFGGAQVNNTDSSGFKSRLDVTCDHSQLGIPNDFRWAIPAPLDGSALACARS